MVTNGKAEVITAKESHDMLIIRCRMSVINDH